jgi:tRNA pseudouridine38-40 synthase
VPRRAFRLAYDGRPFHGFQRQPDVPTVEGRLLAGLADLDLVDDGTAGDEGPAVDAHEGGSEADARRPATRPTPSGYAAAGRTDAGVSALAQTVAFDCPDWCTPRAINAALPGSIRAWAAADAPAGFHATHDAVERTYAYHLHAPVDGVDDDRARAVARRLSGEHDLADLTPDEEGTVRDLDVSVARDGSFLVVTVSAGGFARQLVRRLVGLLRAVATGEAPLAKVDRVLGPEPVTGPEGVAPAPPTPLVLTDVRYPGLSFRVDEAAAASAREAFAERRVDALVAARVTGAVVDGAGHAGASGDER